MTSYPFCDQYQSSASICESAKGVSSARTSCGAMDGVDDPASGPPQTGAEKPAIVLDAGNNGVKAARMPSLRRWRTASKREAATGQKELKPSAVNAIENAPPISYFALWRYGLNRHLHASKRSCRIDCCTVVA